MKKLLDMHIIYNKANKHVIETVRKKSVARKLRLEVKTIGGMLLGRDKSEQHLSPATTFYAL